jgi:hypothetical protein
MALSNQRNVTGNIDALPYILPDKSLPYICQRLSAHYIDLSSLCWTSKGQIGSTQTEITWNARVDYRNRLDVDKEARKRYGEWTQHKFSK